MARFSFFFLLFLFASRPNTSAQPTSVIAGKIMDGETNLPLPGVSIRIDGKTRGTVTNADGIFLLPESELGTARYLLFSHIGYERDTISITALRYNPTIWLHPSPYLLHEVEISSKLKSQFPYELLYDAIKQYRLLQDSEQSKAYFLLQSESNGIPIEILEGYYNAVVSPGRGIEELTLVNGRIGISSLNDKNYLSLNTTDLLLAITPFYDNPENPFPESPGTVSFSRFKRLYTVTIKKYLKRNNERHFIVEFTPRKNREFYFSGLAYINEADLTIDKLEFLIPNCQVPVLHPIDPADRIRSMQLAFAVYFDNSVFGKSRIDRISLGYEIGYINTQSLQSAALQTHADLFLYDYGALFMPPLISKSVFSNDYQAILTIPYEHMFWEQNQIMAPSARQQEILEFFRQQGILANYNDQPHDLLKADFKAWDPDSLLGFSDLTGSPMKQGNPMRSEFMHEKYDFQHDLYNIRGDILIQPFMINDTLRVNSKTLLHLSDSYYYSYKNPSSKLFINLLFDLCEVSRLEILDRLLDLQQSGPFSIESLKKVYSSGMHSLDSLSNALKKEMHQGTDIEASKKWNQFIIDRTGVDRQAQILLEIQEKPNEN